MAVALLGLAFLMNPLVGVAALPYVLGFFALIGGAGSIAFAFMERSARKQAAKLQPAGTAGS